MNRENNHRCIKDPLSLKIKKAAWRRLPVVFTIVIVVTTACGSHKTFNINFDSSKEISGRKFALQDIAPGLPSDWDAYNFVVVEFKISTPQRFHIGFTTDWGYNELRILSYTPNGWNRLAIPLTLYTSQPGAAADMAATYNQPRYTGWIGLGGGKRGPLHGIDSIGVRMRAPINNPTFEIRSVSLSVEDPGDQYLETVPLVNEFGQWNLGNYEGKMESLDQLRQEWKSEEDDIVSTDAYHYSPYGGYLDAKEKSTGFFRIQKVKGRWWFVDPQGYLFLSIGVDCVGPGKGGDVKDVEKRRNMFKELPPDNLWIGSRRNANIRIPSFGVWNLYRRYGDDYREKSLDRIIKRMDKWGVNTIANWSDPDVVAMNKKAFMLQLGEIGIDRGLMGLADVYAPDFVSTVDRSVKEFVSSYRDNPWLIGYFTANEPAWQGNEERLCSVITEGSIRPIKTKLTSYLAEGDTPQRRKDFIHDTFRIFVGTVAQSVKEYDPNHLNLGIRFGSIRNIDREILEIGKDYFDVLSFNCYDLYPRKEMLDRALEITGLPMIIGEYHFGTVDRGMAQSLIQVDSQKERGAAYRYYTEQGYAHPALIGTAWFQWCDEDLTGRFDGENYNCGLVDVTDRPYTYQVEAMMETAKRLFKIHSGEMAPVDQQPAGALGHEALPALWNE